MAGLLVLKSLKLGFIVHKAQIEGRDSLYLMEYAELLTDLMKDVDSYRQFKL